MNEVNIVEIVSNVFSWTKEKKVVIVVFVFLNERKYETHLDLLTIPQTGGEMSKCLSGTRVC